MALSVPGPDGAAIVINQSASVVAKSELMKRVRRGEPIPDGWALGGERRATTDAEAALKGASGNRDGRRRHALNRILEVGRPISVRIAWPERG